MRLTQHTEAKIGFSKLFLFGWAQSIKILHPRFFETTFYMMLRSKVLHDSYWNIPLESLWLSTVTLILRWAFECNARSTISSVRPVVQPHIGTQQYWSSPAILKHWNWLGCSFEFWKGIEKRAVPLHCFVLSNRDSSVADTRTFYGNLLSWHKSFHTSTYNLANTQNTSYKQLHNVNLSTQLESQSQTQIQPSHSRYRNPWQVSVNIVLSLHPHYDSQER